MRSALLSRHTSVEPPTAAPDITGMRVCRGTH